jgi:hypothetical protein
MPRYNQIVNALTWMSHSQNLRRVAREHPIDLYLQPPVTRFRLLDYHLMDRIVRDSNRCAAAVSIHHFSLCLGVHEMLFMWAFASLKAPICMSGEAYVLLAIHRLPLDICAREVHLNDGGILGYLWHCQHLQQFAILNAESKTAKSTPFCASSGL